MKATEKQINYLNSLNNHMNYSNTGLSKRDASLMISLQKKLNFAVKNSFPAMMNELTHKMEIILAKYN